MKTKQSMGAHFTDASDHVRPHAANKSQPLVLFTDQCRTLAIEEPGQPQRVSGLLTKLGYFGSMFRRGNDNSVEVKKAALVGRRFDSKPGPNQSRTFVGAGAPSFKGRLRIVPPSFNGEFLSVAVEVDVLAPREIEGEAQVIPLVFRRRAIEPEILLTITQIFPGAVLHSFGADVRLPASNQLAVFGIVIAQRRPPAA